MYIPSEVTLNELTQFPSSHSTVRNKKPAEIDRSHDTQSFLYPCSERGYDESEHERRS